MRTDLYNSFHLNVRYVNCDRTDIFHQIFNYYGFILTIVELLWPGASEIFKNVVLWNSKENGKVLIGSN